MNDIYSPPQADISVNREGPQVTFLKSLGGFILSLIGINALVLAAGEIHRLLFAVAAIDTAPPYVAFGIVRLLLHLSWIIAWPVVCRKRGWPNLNRGARWHRLLFIAIVIAGIVILFGIGLFA